MSLLEQAMPKGLRPVVRSSKITESEVLGALAAMSTPSGFVEASTRQIAEVAVGAPPKPHQHADVFLHVTGATDLTTRVDPRLNRGKGGIVFFRT